jgi:hypothetical protein
VLKSSASLILDAASVKILSFTIFLPLYKLQLSSCTDSHHVLPIAVSRRRPFFEVRSVLVSTDYVWAYLFFFDSLIDPVYLREGFHTGAMLLSDILAFRMISAALTNVFRSDAIIITANFKLPGHHANDSRTKNSKWNENERICIFTSFDNFGCNLDILADIQGSFNVSTTQVWTLVVLWQPVCWAALKVSEEMIFYWTYLSAHYAESEFLVHVCGCHRRNREEKSSFLT